jgi:hypothetical protein
METLEALVEHGMLGGNIFPSTTTPADSILAEIDL